MPSYLPGMTMSTPYGLIADVLVDPVELDLELLGREADGAEDAEAAGLQTAATTSRQWVKAKIGSSMPSRSQSGVCIEVRA